MDERNEPRHERPRKQQISGIQIVFASILSIGLLLTINFSARIRRGQQIEEVRSRIEATISVLSTEQADLMAEREYASSDIAVIEWAHREGKMVREGEILVLPVQPANAQVTTPTPVATLIPLTTPTEAPVWHLWWKLFFDSDPPGN